MLTALLAFMPEANSSPLSLLTGESEKTKQENQRKASEMLEELLNDGTLTETESNSSFIELIGSIADNVLASIHESLSPSIAGLISSGNASIAGKGFLDDGKYFNAIEGKSILGKLIAALLCMECIILGFKSFLSSDGRSFGKTVSRLITIALTLAFLAFIPLIGKTIINIFGGLGNAISGKYAASGAKNQQRLFLYMPSDILDALCFCKNMLSVEKVRIGGYTLPTIIPHLSISIGELLISLPFLYMMMMIVFWYSEMFVILLSAYIIIPVCTLSGLDLGGIRSILRALIMQGMKLFSGIFIANMSTYIIITSIRKLDGMISSTSNAIIFCLFMTLVILFLIIKGPNAMINAISGETEKNSNSLVTAAVAGGISALGSALPALGKKGKKPESNLPQPYSPTGKLGIPTERKGRSETASKPNSGSETKTGTTPGTAKDATGKIGSEQHKSLAKYGEVTARATPKRMEAARTELMNEGVENISENMIKDRAIRDAKIEKLVKMEKDGFKTPDGQFNKPAFDQLQRLRKGGL